MAAFPTKREDFEAIYHADGTCTHWHCGKPGVVLAYDSFSRSESHIGSAQRVGMRWEAMPSAVFWTSLRIGELSKEHAMSEQDMPAHRRAFIDNCVARDMAQGPMVPEDLLQRLDITLGAL